MPYVYELDKKTGRLEQKGLCCDNLPNTLDCNGTIDKFSFHLPIGYKPYQIFWNKREPAFDEHYLLLKKEKESPLSENTGFYTGDRTHLTKRSVIEFKENEQGFEWRTCKIVYVGERKNELRIETEQIGNYKGEFPNKTTLFCGDGKTDIKIPLEEMLVRGKSSL